VPNDHQTAPDDDLELQLEARDESLVLWDPWADPSAPVVCLGQAPSPPLFILTLDAMQDMLGHGSAETDREVGGVLVGQFIETPRGTGARIDDIIIADSAVASLTHVTFTHESWQSIYQQLEQRDDQARIVGWYHTHPGFGPFLSGQDLFIQRNFFSHPLHVALVLDPVQRLFATFGWSGGEITKSQGCYLFATSEQSSELNTLQQTLKYAGEPQQTSALQRIGRLFSGNNRQSPA
jgi:proteasome lid subunit RPN8/RPN11